MLILSSSRMVMLIRPATCRQLKVCIEIYFRLLVDDLGTRLVVFKLFPLAQILSTKLLI